MRVTVGCAVGSTARCGRVWVGSVERRNLSRSCSARLRVASTASSLAPSRVVLSVSAVSPRSPITAASSLGALFVWRRTERLTKPLLAYAVVEFGTGLIGLAFHDVFVWATGFAYDAVFPSIGVGLAQTNAIFQAGHACENAGIVAGVSSGIGYAVVSWYVVWQDGNQTVVTGPDAPQQYDCADTFS